MSNDPLERLRELAKHLPFDLVADWRDTNHFELVSLGSTHEFWWFSANNEDDWSDQLESGRRMGLLLDIAAEVSRLKREGVLIEKKGGE